MDSETDFRRLGSPESRTPDFAALHPGYRLGRSLDAAQRNPGAIERLPPNLLCTYDDAVADGDRVRFDFACI